MFIKPSVVKKYVHGKGRRASKQFLNLLDAHIQNKLDEAVAVHNGGKKTLDEGVAGFIGLAGKRK